MFVAATLWITRDFNQKMTIENISLAILSGYSADSLFRLATERLGSQSSDLVASKEPPKQAGVEAAAQNGAIGQPAVQ